MLQGKVTASHTQPFSSRKLGASFILLGDVYPCLEFSFILIRLILSQGFSSRVWRK